jgi:hypothetical protein
VRAENPAALRYILQDDIYLLQSDKVALKNALTPAAETQPAASVSTSRVEPATEFPSLLQAPMLTAPMETKEQEPVAQTPVLTAPIQTPAPAYNYLGGNKKHFLILTHYAGEEFIAADHLAALQSILKRKEYELADVAIINVAKFTTTIIDLVGYFKPEKLLILGEAAVPAGMGIPPLNQHKKMKNGLLLRSFSFSEMMSSNENKKAFWEQVKNL